MSYVEISSVKKKYSDKTVLNDISFSIGQGEFITLLGQSGCGKSTLLRAIAGIDAIDGGAIVVNGKDITNLPSRKRDIGMVFQSYALFPNMTVAENIGYGLRMKKKKDDDAVQRMIDSMGLGGMEDSYPNQLSGGQQQRVALARALIMKPKILLLDEPLSALDAKIRKALQIEIKRIQREMNITTIFVTHDQKEAMILSDRIYVMNQGVIEQHGTPENIYTRPKNRFVASFIGAYNIFDSEEIKDNIDGAYEAGLSDIAIRPESMGMSRINERTATEDAFKATGRVLLRTINGSIVNYQIQLKTKIIQVERLFQGRTDFSEGETVELSIPRSACVQLE